MSLTNKLKFEWLLWRDGEIINWTVIVIIFLFFFFFFVFFSLANFRFFVKWTYVKTIIYKYISNLARIHLIKTKKNLRNLPNVNSNDTRTISTAVILMSALSNLNTPNISHQRPHRRLSRCNFWLGINKKQLAIYRSWR